MSSKFGPNAPRVVAFLDDVRNSDVASWRSYVDLPLPPRLERKTAVRAMGDVPLSASVAAAISKESLAAFRATGVDSSMFPEKTARFLAIPSDIELACTAIAAGDRVSHEHARSLLKPFADAGLTSAAEEIARLSGA